MSNKQKPLYKQIISMSAEVVPTDLQAPLSRAITHIGREFVPLSDVRKDGGHLYPSSFQVGVVVTNNGQVYRASNDGYFTHRMPGRGEFVLGRWSVSGWDFARPLTDIDWEATILFYEMQTPHQP